MRTVDDGINEWLPRCLRKFAHCTADLLGRPGSWEVGADRPCNCVRDCNVDNLASMRVK